MRNGSPPLRTRSPRMWLWRRLRSRRNTGTEAAALFAPRATPSQRCPPARLARASPTTRRIRPCTRRSRARYSIYGIEARAIEIGPELATCSRYILSAGGSVSVWTYASLGSAVRQTTLRHYRAGRVMGPIDCGGSQKGRSPASGGASTASCGELAFARSHDGPWWGLRRGSPR